MMRNKPALLSYVVRYDRGLAPNPFWGYCTLAVCTPNHMNAKAEKGDWIFGNLGKNRGWKFVYAMQVDQILEFDDYFHDPRFINKKPKLDGTWQDRCGDNMYFLNSGRHYQQLSNPFHCNSDVVQKDTRYPRVFIGRHFYYLGKNAEAIPPDFRSLICHGKGIRWHRDAKINEGFLTWLRMNFKPDQPLGEPLDKEVSILCAC
jgi:Nucleotide modification associated domain 2